MITLSESFDLVHDATAMYRALLEAMANPGREVPLPVEEDPWLATAVTLLDGEVGFYWDGPPELRESLRFLTGARPAEPEQADFIFSRDIDGLKALLPRAKTGTFTDPHLSATLITKAGGKKIPCKLRGPGIKPGSGASLPEDILEAMDCRDALEPEYPCGLDMVFFTEIGVIAIPRLIRREKE